MGQRLAPPEPQEHERAERLEPDIGRERGGERHQHVARPLEREALEAGHDADAEHDHDEGADPVDRVGVGDLPAAAENPLADDEGERRRDRDHREQAHRELKEPDAEIEPDEPQRKRGKRERRDGVGRDHDGDRERRVEPEDDGERDGRADHRRGGHEYQPLLEAVGHRHRPQEHPHRERRRDHGDDDDDREHPGAAGIALQALDIQPDHRDGEKAEHREEDRRPEEIGHRGQREADHQPAGHAPGGAAGDGLEAASDQ